MGSEEMEVNDHQLSCRFFVEIGFTTEITKDGSPTLRIINGSERGGESMHHTGGAFSETCLIYGQAFENGFKAVENPVIVSLGLGLGYVEVLAVVYSLLHNSLKPQIFSFETVKGLRTLFEDFYLDRKESSAHQWILEKMAEKFHLDSAKLKQEVKQAIIEKRLLLLGDFVTDCQAISKFDIFCYDAYSKKTSPQLWDEALMTHIFSKGSEKSCISSYASNGALKRSLIQSGYKIEKLDGFQGKRNRTWAYREQS